MFGSSESIKKVAKSLISGLSVPCPLGTEIVPGQEKKIAIMWARSRASFV